MIEELADILPTFPGSANRMRCFMHILNLVAMSMIRQFDIPKSQMDEALDTAAQELVELAKELDDGNDNIDIDDEIDNNNADGWVDECAEMLKADRDKLDASIQPVRLTLVKVSTSLEDKQYLYRMFHGFVNCRSQSRTQR
jgi:hypothetical protein